MCGISGILSKDRSSLEEINTINEVLYHRGPDGGDTLVLDEAALGHRRLSIVDLSDAGKQPMSYKDRYWITYNGEIYNYIELRAELEPLGYTFKSGTDTEVVMAAYDYWGTTCFNRFNGMWSFMIHDTKTNEYIISRDRFGIKPLYYYSDNNVFVFASEIKAILKHSAVKSGPNREYIKSYLVNGPSEWRSHTAFENIYSFDHACYLKGNIDDFLGGNIGSKPYWELKGNPSIEKFDPAKAEGYARRYKELLADAVKLRLRSDVKVGSALSGGLDSSSIVQLINTGLKEKEGTDEKQETFSSIYPSEATKECDESEHIERLADYLKVKSNTIEPVASDIIEEHRKMIHMMDNPPETTCMSGWHTFKLVGTTDVTVTLDGQGADEQLAGYLNYVYLHLRNCKDPDQQAEKFRQIPGINLRRMEEAISFNKKYGWLRPFYKPVLKKIFKSRFDSFEGLNDRLAKDVMSHLVQLIHYSDRVSMAFSKESRMPFMDYRLVEFNLSVPAVYKLHEGWTKWVARKAMENDLPEETTFRKDKMGWPIPEEYWFKGPLREWFVSKITNSAFLKSLNEDTDVEKRMRSGEKMKLLIRLLNVAVWYEVFFENKKPA